MKLRPVEEIPPKTRVVLRLDTDLPIEGGQILDNSRLVKSLTTIKFLLEKECRLFIVGHRGRPRGKEDDLSLKPVYLELISLLEENGNEIESVFLEDIKDINGIDKAMSENAIVFGENVRFWGEEEANDSRLFERLPEVIQAFVNDAFAVAHRKQASIMIHKILPAFYGLSFIEEADKIERLVNNPEKPVTVVLGGAKEDKLKYLPELTKIADYVLVGGKLPLLMTNDQLLITNEKIKIATLRPDKLDLSADDILEFKEIISSSKTIIWAGAMGFYEKQDCKRGTEEMAKTIATASGYKVVAGGDTGASIVNLGLKDRIDFICSGGGVMLEYLSKKSLPAWE